MERLGINIAYHYSTKLLYSWLCRSVATQTNVCCNCYLPLLTGTVMTHNVTKYDVEMTSGSSVCVQCEYTRCRTVRPCVQDELQQCWTRTLHSATAPALVSLVVVAAAVSAAHRHKHRQTDREVCVSSLLLRARRTVLQLHCCQCAVHSKQSTLSRHG